MSRLVDELWMRHCLELAERGAGKAAPNPLVGAVLVHRGSLIGSGWHQQFGGPHAEINAIADAPTELLSEAQLYVNLEPCAHHGKTPPCSEAIIQAGIGRVVAGCRDPFPATAGRGLSTLRAHGVQVSCGVLERECVLLNRRFFTAQLQQRPYVLLKWAQTADGFIARPDYSSKWISCEASRTAAHQLRAEEAAVLVGTNTAHYDNPQLNVRQVAGPNPLRVVLDRSLRLAPDLALFDGQQPTWVLNEQRSGQDGLLRWIKLDFSNRVPQQVLELLHSAGILSLLVEGGAQLLQSFIAADLWDEVQVFQSPERFGAGIPAPMLKADLLREEICGADRRLFYRSTGLEELLPQPPPTP